MTVKELIELLSKCSPDKKIYLSVDDLYEYELLTIQEDKEIVIISNELK